MCEKIRCSWAGDLPIYVDYHDNEWGRPIHNDNKLFEMLILEGMQAGLSWITVLKKREAFRKAFDRFDPEKVALYDEIKIQELTSNEKIIRNRLKINSAVTNANPKLGRIKVDFVPSDDEWLDQGESLIKNGMKFTMLEGNLNKDIGFLNALSKNNNTFASFKYYSDPKLISLFDVGKVSSSKFMMSVKFEAHSIS